MGDERKKHWQGVYEEKSTEELTWYQEYPSVSMDLIERAVEGLPERDGPIRLIDVGAGASTLEDALVERRGFEVTALDIAPEALERTRERLEEEQAATITWRVADVTQQLEGLGPFEIWHDRAVFHFLTEAADREAYRKNLEGSLVSGGFAIMSTFSPEGPETCSGLPVRRYSAAALSEELGAGWRQLASVREDHPTPWGGTQNFTYGLFRREEG